MDFVIYWSKLVMGLFFGFASYMIMRVSDLTFFLMVPLLLILAIVITLLIVRHYDQKYNVGLTQRQIIKRSLMYTGTYFLAFITLATLSFYWGA
jgi:hypothetical protein